jgi:hypothetical protein
MDYQKELCDWLVSKNIDFYMDDDWVKCGPRYIKIIDVAECLVIKDHCPVEEMESIIIFSDEWINRNKQVKNFIASQIGRCHKIYARECKIQEVNVHTAREFIEKHHIQGSNNLGVVFFGLYYNEELVGVMSLGRHHRQVADNKIILDRLCFVENILIVGGASRLFSRCVAWAKERNYDEIISFSDTRLTQGHVYETLEFICEKVYRPDYSYVKIGDTTTRLSKQSQKKSAVSCPADMTELEWATARGLTRIYDLGKKRWTFLLRDGLSWKQKLSLNCSKQHEDGVFKHSHIRGYFKSDKNQDNIYFGSSYELRCAFLMEQDADITSFRRCDNFWTGERFRCPDFFVEKENGIEIWEIKPIGWLRDPNVIKQIDDTKAFCNKHGYAFRLWSEQDSELGNEKAIIKWAKKYLKSLGDVEFAERQRINAIKRSIKYYRNHIANDKINVYCEYCHKKHSALRLTYERNISRNGRYICEKEGGHIAGSRPKLHLQKENPYADQGMKQCVKCQRILPFASFGTDKGRRDGYASRCKECRSAVAKEKYALRL